MKIPHTMPQAAPEARPTHGKPAPRPDDEAAVRRPGRSHTQRDMKHLLRDVRHQIRDEIGELRVAEGADSEKIAAVREAYTDFKTSLQDAFHDAGRGRAFDGAAMPEAVRLAMVSFTEALAVINGTVAAAEEPAVAPTDPLVVPPKPEEDTPPPFTIEPGVVLDTVG